MRSSIPHIIGPSFSTFTRTVCLYAEELGLEYTQGMHYKGKNITFDSEALRQLNPFGRVPILVMNGQKLFETVAICFYLDHLAKESLIPSDLASRLNLEQWASALITEVDSLLIRRYLLEFIFPKGDNGEVRLDYVDKIEPKVINILNILSQQLGNRTFFCGDAYSVADALLIPMLDYLANTLQRPTLFKDSGNLLLYLEEMRKRPSTINIIDETSAHHFQF